MKKLLLTVVASLFALTTSATAQSIAGEWDASINTPGGARAFKILFKVDGEKLSGTVKRSAGDVPLTGTITGNVVKFSYTVIYNDNPLPLAVTATLDGDSMKGIVDMAGQAQEEFSAKRAAPAPDTARELPVSGSLPHSRTRANEAPSQQR